MTSAASSRLTPVTIAGPAGALEGLLQARAHSEVALASAVCHPHPLHGGTLHNKVVHRVASTLHALGAAVLRFNFRGVGGSEGGFGGGPGELEDARAALAWLGGRFPGARLWVAGFSFGAWVAARVAGSEPRVERLVLVAPPVRSASFDFLKSVAVPKLVIQGTRDRVCPIEALEAEFPAWADPKELRRVEGASHFFDRQLRPLGEALREALAGPAAARS